MENFKIDILKEENIDIKYESLNNKQVIQIITDIESQYGNISQEGKSFFDIIRNNLSHEEIELSTINKEEGFRDLCSLFNMELKEKKEVFVLWDEQNIDIFSMSDLYYYWNYIWYGSSDECCIIYFPDNKTLFMVNDYGIVYYRFHK